MRPCSPRIAIGPYRVVVLVAGPVRQGQGCDRTWNHILVSYTSTHYSRHFKIFQHLGIRCSIDSITSQWSRHYNTVPSFQFQICYPQWWVEKERNDEALATLFLILQIQFLFQILAQHITTLSALPLLLLYNSSTKVIDGLHQSTVYSQHVRHHLLSLSSNRYSDYSISIVISLPYLVYSRAVPARRPDGRQCPATAVGP